MLCKRWPERSAPWLRFRGVFVFSCRPVQRSSRYLNRWNLQGKGLAFPTAVPAESERPILIVEDDDDSRALIFMPFREAEARDQISPRRHQTLQLFCPVLHDDDLLSRRLLAGAHRSLEVEQESPIRRHVVSCDSLRPESSGRRLAVPR